ncbi:MAG: hypothetical protein AAF969_04470 [Bacteroidota bacterium]
MLILNRAVARGGAWGEQQRVQLSEVKEIISKEVDMRYWLQRI